MYGPAARRRAIMPAVLDVCLPPRFSLIVHAISSDDNRLLPRSSPHSSKLLHISKDMLQIKVSVVHSQPYCPRFSCTSRNFHLRLGKAPWSCAPPTTVIENHVRPMLLLLAYGLFAAITPSRFLVPTMLFPDRSQRGNPE